MSLHGRTRVSFATVFPLLFAIACDGGATTTTSSSSPDGTEDPATAPGSGGGNAGGANDAGGGSEPGEPAPLPYVHFDVNHVLSTGQSNAVAIGAKEVLSSAQPYANLMFDPGVMTSASCNGDGCREYVKPTGFVPLVEGDRFFSWSVETMSSGLANEVSKIARVRNLDPSHAVLVSLHGRSGNTYWCLRKGGCTFKGTEQGLLPAFSEGMRQVEDGLALAKAGGKSYVVRAVTAIHGESDHYGYSAGQPEFPLPSTDGAGTIHDYGEGLLEWQRDYEAGVKAITGQPQPVPLFISQMDNWTDRPHSEVVQYQYEAHVRSQGKVVLVTPGYPLPWASDCLHFTGAGERRLGEYFAKAYARVVLEGKRWEPVHPKSVQASGSTVVARFHVPKPPLVFDTKAVGDPGNYGFEVVDGAGANVTITQVAITAPDTVTVTLDRPAAAGMHLRYAFTESASACPGPFTGPRGNLRDSDDTPAESGSPLYDWGVHFDVAVK